MMNQQGRCCQLHLEDQTPLYKRARAQRHRTGQWWGWNRCWKLKGISSSPPPSHSNPRGNYPEEPCLAALLDTSPRASRLQLVSWYGDIALTRRAAGALTRSYFDIVMLTDKGVAVHGSRECFELRNGRPVHYNNGRGYMPD
ncbi:uncharacterized protein ATNIH1004_001967 [Aspergillus tanneri]|uniref:Uncharacterized protein n=1 Tax=Aspergillus tanneri TaxID=1220188 RepID=A0A5M9M307_9EURO|nr:uncharacterized protein ATNIH1004_001967 [Aspergillus tanneri]KAA8641365.1 hypothetical protein ATNIH1004_001967 [Aspergillus tanneri]